MISNVSTDRDASIVEQEIETAVFSHDLVYDDLKRLEMRYVENDSSSLPSPGNNRTRDPSDHIPCDVD